MRVGECWFPVLSSGGGVQIKRKCAATSSLAAVPGGKGL